MQSKGVDGSGEGLTYRLSAFFYAFPEQTILAMHASIAICLFSICNAGAPFAAVTLGCGQAVEYVHDTSSFVYCLLPRKRWLHCSVHTLDRYKGLSSMPSSISGPVAVPHDAELLLVDPPRAYTVRYTRRRVRPVR
jgi:hypothetical protein